MSANAIEEARRVTTWTSVNASVTAEEAKNHVGVAEPTGKAVDCVCYIFPG